MTLAIDAERLDEVIPALEKMVAAMEQEAVEAGVDADVVIVGIPSSLLARLDAYRGGKTRPQAIRDLLEEHLP